MPVGSGGQVTSWNAGGAMLKPVALFGTNPPGPAVYSRAAALRVISSRLGSRGSITKEPPSPQQSWNAPQSGTAVTSWTHSPLSPPVAYRTEQDNPTLRTVHGGRWTPFTITVLYAWSPC